MFCNTVFRVALYANTDIKAGTEFFFNYNYPEEMTKNFKQPKGKAVAVKQTTKVTSKRELLRAPSKSDAVLSNSGASIAKREGLAKARAAKAAKAAKAKALFAAVGANTATAPKIARKIATGAHTFAFSKNANVQRRLKRSPGFETRNRSTASRSVIESDEDTRRRGRTRTDLVVQDTDEDDENEDIQSGDARGCGREHPNAEKPTRPNTREEHAFSNDNPRRSGRSRSWPQKFDMEQVYAVKEVKKVKKKMGGARPGAGRKRKRPIVFNSDDE